MRHNVVVYWGMKLIVNEHALGKWIECAKEQVD